jgi:hypothetical protein
MNAKNSWDAMLANVEADGWELVTQALVRHCCVWMPAAAFRRGRERLCMVGPLKYEKTSVHFLEMYIQILDSDRIFPQAKRVKFARNARKYRAQIRSKALENRA